ncbi:sugar transferase [Cognatishimia sp. 1_MG-2023]|uniref:sugar transferase n=1 Tax=Cognatishimia sp. 1_MG-2023 TaxID=3062642 RepID=UPI0034A1B734
MAKRFVDILGAAVLLCVLVIILPFAALFIRLSGKGPIFYNQLRVGKDEQPFRCYKLRTMRQNTPLLATHNIKSEYITRVGRFLRGTKLDELPQGINVLRGDMSLIGPRPCLCSQEHIVETRRKKDIFRTRPGIAGLAQACNVDMSQPRKLVKYDAIYLKNQSVCFDLTIAVCVLGGSRATRKFISKR